MDFVQKLLERAKTDACRNNPFAAALGENLGTRAVNANAGLAMTTAPELGYFIAFATQPGICRQRRRGAELAFHRLAQDPYRLPGPFDQRPDDRRAQRCRAGNRRPGDSMGSLGAVLALLFQGRREPHRLRRRGQPEIVGSGRGLGLGARHVEPGSPAAVHHDLSGLRAYGPGEDQARQPEADPGW